MQTETYIQNSINPIVENYNLELENIKSRLNSLEEDFTKLVAFINTINNKVK